MKGNAKLGRGLSALLGESHVSLNQEDLRTQQVTPLMLRVSDLKPSRFQPRQTFDGSVLTQLADSIRATGILQPLIVRKDPKDSSQYEIIAGERRWRAAQMAGLFEVPVIVKDISDQECLEIALIENVQREDLNAVEEAEAYQKLIEELKFTQEELSGRIGKSRSHIANMLRLLTLPRSVLDMVKAHQLSFGHAKVLVAAENPEKFADEILKKKLTVRQTEALVSHKQGENKVKRTKERSFQQPVTLDEDHQVLRDQFERLIGLKTELVPIGSGGKVEVYYASPEELDELLARLDFALLHLPSIKGDFYDS